MLPDLAIFHHFGKIFKDFGHFRGLLQCLTKFWTYFDMYWIRSRTRQTDKYWTKKLSICSHWLLASSGFVYDSQLASAIKFKSSFLAHARQLAALIAAFFTLLSILGADFAAASSSVSLAKEFPNFVLNVGPAPKRATAEAGHSAVVADELLKRVAIDSLRSPSLGSQHHPAIYWTKSMLWEHSSQRDICDFHHGQPFQLQTQMYHRKECSHSVDFAQ